MFGADDTLDDIHWLNIQDPIKQMFLSLTKAIRTQAAGIRDLDRKCNDMISIDAAERMVKDHFNTCCTKQDATQLIYQIDTKAGDKDLAILDNRIQQALHQIEKLNDAFQSQAILIADTNNRMDGIAHDIQILKNPNYGQLYGYIDQQIGTIFTEMDRKLLQKADQKAVETCIPARVEDLYRALTTKVDDMQVDIARAATKEEFQLLANNKANLSDVAGLLSEVSDKVTRHDLHSSVNNQITPLITALTSIEKAIQIQDIAAKHNQSAFTEKAASIEKMYREYKEHKLTSDATAHTALTREKVTQLVDDYVRDRRLGEVTAATVESSLAHQTEYLLKQMGILGESIRLELVSVNRDEFHSVQHAMTGQIQDVTALAKEISEKHKVTRKKLNEFSLSVAKSLSKKVDVKEFRHVVLNSQAQQQAGVSHSMGLGASTLFPAPPSGGGGGFGQSTSRSVFGANSATTSPHRNSSSSKGSKGYSDIVHTSRDLRQESRDDNFLSQESDVNTEFDFLIRNMREGAKYSSSSSGGEGEGGDAMFHTARGGRSRSVSAGAASRRSYGASGNNNSRRVRINENDNDEHSSDSLSRGILGSRRDRTATGGGGGGSNSRTSPQRTSSPYQQQSTQQQRPAENYGFMSSTRRFNSTSGKGGKDTQRTRSNSPSRSSRLSEEDAQAIAALQRTVATLSTELDALKRTVSSTLKGDDHSPYSNMIYNKLSSSSSHTATAVASASTSAAGGGGGGGGVPTNHFAASMSTQNAVAADLDRLDWRLAVGEVSANLRRELADKCSREEMYSALRGKIERFEEKVAGVQAGIDSAATASELARVEGELTALRSKVASEMVGARFIWTSQLLVADNLIPWDLQAVNAAPNVYIWTKATTELAVRIPGVYRICVSVFTSVPMSLQIYLNDEPLFAYQPDTLDTATAISNQNPLIQRKDKYNLRRLRHSAGEVTCLTIDEFVSLPADSRFKVRFRSSEPAQAFFSIKKV